MTTTRDELLPFSPLTHDELQKRRQWHTEECGYIARGVVRHGGRWSARDLERLEHQATLAEDYSRGSLLRSPNLRRT
jgi:hypothetical protein